VAKNSRKVVFATSSACHYLGSLKARIIRDPFPYLWYPKTEDVKLPRPEGRRFPVRKLNILV
jgi:hypothetical protein